MANWDIKQEHRLNMSAIVMALVTCLGTWIALRRHPLYAGHAFVRIVGGVFLLIAGGAGVMIMAIGLTLHRALAVQLSAMMGALVLIGVGMALGATALMTPRGSYLDTRLAPEVPLVNLHRRIVYRWGRLAFAFIGLCALAALIPGPARQVALALAIPMIVAVVVGLPATYLKAYRMDRAATALELNPWLHWHYSADAEAAWIAVQVQRLSSPPPKRAWRILLCVCAVIFAAALFLIDGPWAVRAAWGLAGATLIVGLVEAALIMARRAPQRLEQRLRAAAPDAYFGNDGVVCEGRLLTWLDSAQYLTSATVNRQAPRSVALVFKKIMPGGYLGPRTMTLRQAILIPADAGDADLRLLQSALSTRCPSAEVQLLTGFTTRNDLK